MHDIVYLSRVLWDSLYQRPQHLAAGLAGHGRVLYVDTPRSTFVRRVLKPLRARTPVRPFLWRPLADRSNLTVLSPAYVPFVPGVWPPPGQYAVSRRFLRWATQRLGISRPIVWTSDPRDLYFLDDLHPRFVCYDCMDDYALIAPSPALQQGLRRQELVLLQRADVVFASSASLARRCRENNPNVVLVPNGVDAARFAGAPVIPADLAAIPEPRIGYAGSLAAWVNFDLLDALARSRPQWSIVLVGPVLKGAEARIAALRELPNVHVLGERPYQTIPSYLSGFSVCLIPFVLDDLTRAVNPVKFYEYMAAARPVVATPLPELATYGDVCTLANDAPGFIAGVEAALAEPGDGALRQRRLAVAHANSWQQRVHAIVAAMQNLPKVSQPSEG